MTLDEKILLDILDKICKGLSNVENIQNFIAGLLCLLNLQLKQSYSNLELMDSCFKEEALPSLLKMMKIIILNLKLLDSTQESLQSKKLEVQKLYSIYTNILSSNS